MAIKPVPEKIPLERLVPEFPIRIEVNGQKVSPLVPTLFLLPGDPIVIRTQKISPPPLISQNTFSPVGEVPRPSPSYKDKEVRFEKPLASGSKSKSCPEAESWSVVFNGRPMSLEGNNLFSGATPQDPGLYPLEIDCRQKGRQATVPQGLSREEWGEETRITLLVIVLHPFSRVIKGFIDQYPIGFYPNPEETPANLIPKPGLSSYLPPKGFIQLTPENQGVFVSRHYRLQDFACRFKAPFPHYLAISPDLLLKLELLILKLQYLGNPEARLTIISGFRTPWYNQTVSGVRWSRHLYGDAADIIVDVSPQDGLMDDLNQDGRISREDALFLAKFIEEIEEETGLPGGLGIYDWGKVGPFVHIDTRGFKARW